MRWRVRTRSEQRQRVALLALMLLAAAAQAAVPLRPGSGDDQGPAVLGHRQLKQIPPGYRGASGSGGAAAPRPPRPPYPPPRPPPPSPPAPPPESPCGALRLDTDLKGGDISNGVATGVSTVAICCATCMTRSDCGAYTFVPAAKTCYLKNFAGRPPPPPSKVIFPPPISPVPLRPNINFGLHPDGSQPTVLEVLGPARSTYHFYDPEYRVSTLYCADAFAGKSDAWLKAYPWIAYCAPYLGGMTQDKCGKCLRMTNNRTGWKVIVRMVDMCGHSAIDSDHKSAFIPLDTDGQGYLDGQLSVTLERVDCKGPAS